MDRSHSWRDVLFSDLGILILLALARLLLHTLTNGQYGFHRDELAMLDNARHLDWGFVDYPPLTAFIVRVGLVVFGQSLTGLRFFGALSQSIAMVLTGLMAREMGGRRLAQVVAAMAVWIAPSALALATMFQYTTFDYLWWVLVAYLVVRLLKSEDPRWWLGIGAAIGLGLMTKYTMAVCVLGIAAGVVLTKARRYLVSPWLWCGAGLALLICLPNLVWQAQHGFISLDFLVTIHARDIRIGRTQSFLFDQLYLCANPVTIPLWIAGLYYYFFAPDGRRYRMLGWMFAVPFAVMWATQARGYYMAAAYPMLFAGGAVVLEQWLASLPAGRARLAKGIGGGALVAGGVLFAAVALPVAPPGSDWFRVASEINDTFVEEIGWPEMAETVAGIHAALPAADRGRAGIMAGNYGEAGALNLYGPALGLPEAISGINTYWLRGYGDPPPETLIVLGYTRDWAERLFGNCQAAGRIRNPYGVENEEANDWPDVFVCRGPRPPWPELWQRLRHYG